MRNQDMSHEIFLSIIIPCYNVEEYLPATIQSLRVLKNADDCEFIFTNDGSTDNTLAIIQAFAYNDKRAIVIDQRNAGVSAARNAALSIARGQYFLPLDGDDTLTSDAIEIIRKRSKDSDALLTPIQVIKPKRTYISPFQFKAGQYTPYSLYKSCSYFPTAPQLVYKLSIIKDNHIHFNESIHAGEVYAFTSDFFSYCQTINVALDIFYQYRMRDSSAIHKPNYSNDLSVLQIIDYIISITKPAITNLPSFNATIFRMCTSFTYSKYAKFGIIESQAIEVIRQIMRHPSFIKCTKKVAISNGTLLNDRIRAIYILTTGIWGYKLIASFHTKRGQ